MSDRLPIQRLGWAHPLQEREPASGFASRLAALNGVDLYTLLTDMSVNQLDVFCGTDATAREIAALGGLDAAGTEALIRYTPLRLPLKRSTKMASERLDPGSVNRSFFRYCPHCIREDLEKFEGPKSARPWLRSEWLFDHVRSCREHDVVLIDAPPASRRMQAPDFSATISQRVLPVLDELVRDATPSQHSAFEDWIVARLDGVRDPSNWLDDLPLRVGIAFCEALGVSALHPPRTSTKKLPAAEWAKAAAAGYRLAAEGEKGMEPMLSRLVGEQSKTRGVIGLFDTYGYVFKLLLRTQADPDFEKARGVLRRHAFEFLPLERGTVVLGEPLGRRRIHTVQTAAVATGVHAKTIRKVLARKGLYAADPAAELSNHRVNVRIEDIELEVSQLRDALSMEAVLKITGIPRTHLITIISLGFLPSLTDSNKIAGARHRFARADVDALMERLFRGAESIDVAADHQTSVMRARFVATAKVNDLVKWIAAGTLRWKGRIGTELRYENLLVDTNEIKSLVRSEPAMSCIQYRDVENFIRGFGKNSTAAIVSFGALATTEEFSPRARHIVRGVTHESVEAFKTRYISLVELCEISGIGHIRTLKRLRLAGVEPVFPYDVVRVKIFPRQAALDTMQSCASL